MQESYDRRPDEGASDHRGGAREGLCGAVQSRRQSREPGQYRQARWHRTYPQGDERSSDHRGGARAGLLGAVKYRVVEQGLTTAHQEGGGGAGSEEGDGSLKCHRESEGERATALG